MPGVEKQLGEAFVCAKCRQHGGHVERDKLDRDAGGLLHQRYPIFHRAQLDPDPRVARGEVPLYYEQDGV